MVYQHAKVELASWEGQGPCYHLSEVRPCSSSIECHWTSFAIISLYFINGIQCLFIFVMFGDFIRSCMGFRKVIKFVSRIGVIA